MCILTCFWDEPLWSQFDVSTDNIIFSNQSLQLIKPVCSLLCFFSFSFLHMWNQLWRTPGLAHACTLTFILSCTHCTHWSLTHILTHYAVYTSLPSASSTSRQWSPVFASTWHVSGPTGKSQFPLTENTGGSTWTTLSLSSCLMVRLNNVFSFFHDELHWISYLMSIFLYL